MTVTRPCRVPTSRYRGGWLAMVALALAVACSPACTPGRPVRHTTATDTPRVETPARAPSQGVPRQPDPGAVCAPAVYTWVAHCAASEHMAMTAAACPGDGLFIVAASADPATSLRVEIARAPRHGFVSVGDWQLSPVGEYPRWELTPAPLRETFTRVVACVRASAPPADRLRGLPVDAPAGAPSAAPEITPVEPGHGARVPWLLVLAGLTAVAAGWPYRANRSHRARPAWRTLAVGLVAWAVTYVVRRAVLVPAFFHQNGQGPAWIGQIVTGRHHAYGPGFSELFGWVVRLADQHPERGVFAWQAALAALVPVCTWRIARAVGADTALATALALGVAVEPALCRGAGSESYYAACTSLGFLAVTALVRVPARSRVRSVPFALACVTSGLLIAQAVRIHPIGWVAAALTPVALLVRPGSLRRRGIQTVTATVILACTVVLTSGTALRDVVRSDLGNHWLGRPVPGVTHTLWHRGWPAVLLAVVAVAASRRRGRAVFRTTVVLGVLVVAAVADLISPTGSPVWITAAYAMLYAPVLVATVAAVLGGIPRTRTQSRGLAVVLALALVASGVSRWRAITLLPTDALELQHAVAWRDGLPHGARVAAVERAGYYILTLPVYGALGGRDLDTIQLDPMAPPPDLRAYGRDVYYYRASLCSTREARGYCDSLERRNGMTPVAVYTLPAVPSMAHLGYDTATVHVGLYHVRTDIP